MPARGTTALFTLLIKIGPWLLFDASVSTNGNGYLFQQTFVEKKSVKSEEAKFSRDVETVGARPGCTKSKGFSSAQGTNKNKKSFLS